MSPDSNSVDNNTCRSSLSALVAICILALVSRIFVMAAGYSDLGVELTTDALRYDRLARHFLDHGEYIIQGHKAMMAPGYPLFLSAIYLLPGPDRITVLVMQMILGSSMAGVVFLTTTRLFSKRAAMVSGIVSALYLPFVLSSSKLLSEALFIPLLAVSVLFTVRFSQGGEWKDYLLAGLCTGLASLVRPVIFYFPLFLLAVLLLLKARGKTNHSFGKLLVYIAIFFLTLSPWVIRNQVQLGEPVFTSTNTGMVLAASAMPRDGKYYGFNIRKNDLPADKEYIWNLPELERNEALKQLAITHMADNPGEIPHLILLRVMYFFSPFDWEFANPEQGIFNPWFIWLLALALVGYVSTSMTGGHIPVLFMLFYLIGISVATYASPRLRIPAELLLAVYAGAGWVTAEKKIGNKIMWLTASIALILSLTAQYYSVEVKAAFRSVLELTGLW